MTDMTKYGISKLPVITKLAMKIVNVEIAIKKAKTTKSKKDVENAVSLTDKTAKIKAIHKNKAARIKSQLAKLHSLSKLSK